jgi:dUTP pyrophosphatase
MQIKYKKLSPFAIVPTAGTAGAAGLDLYATKDVSLVNGQPVKIPTGLAFEIPAGYCGKVYSRSSSFLKGLILTPLIVDSDYRGEIFVMASFHQSPMSKALGLPDHYEILKGDRIAQICFEAVTPVEFIEAETLSETERGTGGYGSTGR